MSKELIDSIIDRWGSKEEFYAELKRFLKTHQNVNCAIEYDNELQLPIRAVYTFPPIMVAHEHIHLMKALSESNRQQKFEDEN